MSFFKKNHSNHKTIKRLDLNQNHFFKLKQFEIEKSSDPQKKLDLIIYDNRINGKSYQGKTEAEFEFRSTKAGLIYSNVSDELLLALAPELSNYEGLFFGQKTILDFDGKKEERYPVFFSKYRVDYFKGKEVRAHIVGFAYFAKEAIIGNQAVSIQKV